MEQSSSATKVLFEGNGWAWLDCLSLLEDQMEENIQEWDSWRLMEYWGSLVNSLKTHRILL